MQQWCTLGGLVIDYQSTICSEEGVSFQPVSDTNLAQPKSDQKPLELNVHFPVTLSPWWPIMWDKLPLLNFHPITGLSSNTSIPPSMACCLDNAGVGGASHAEGPKLSWWPRGRQYWPVRRTTYLSFGLSTVWLSWCDESWQNHRTAGENLGTLCSCCVILLVFDNVGAFLSCAFHLLLRVREITSSMQLCESSTQTLFPANVISLLNKVNFRMEGVCHKKGRLWN